MDEFLDIIRESLLAVNHPRYYKTERGFQGALLSELEKRLPKMRWEGAIIEQEYQKTLPNHGITIRPDIIIHVPYTSDFHTSREEGNFVVFELKLNANQSAALQDYDHLAEMCEVLKYPLGIFININSDGTFLSSYQGPFRENLHAFAVFLKDNEVVVQE